MGLELLGLLGGALTRLFGFYAEHQKAKQDNAHELAMIDKQIALSKVQHEQKKEEIEVQSNADIDVEWSKALSVALESPRSGNPTIDALNALVRPILTFWWCLILYTTYKGFLVYAAVQEVLTAKQMAEVIVTPFDIAIIGSIVSFHFVDRQLRKFSGK